MELKKKMKSLQQNELNAVPAYLALAERTKNEWAKEQLKSIAADEGKHAAICKRYSEAVLKPRNALKNAVVCMDTLLPRRTVYRLFAAVEKAGGNLYAKLENNVPEAAEIRADEYRHAEILATLIARKGETPPPSPADTQEG